MTTYEYGKGYLPEIWYQCNIPKRNYAVCPHCRIAPDLDPDDWFNDEKALCKEAGNKLIEGMLRPYERVLIPDWCPLKTNKQK